MENIKLIQPMAKIDFHTHILPNIDDGSQSIEQSHRMLELEKKNGVVVVLATPHFYPDGLSPTEFVKVRQEAYEKLELSHSNSPIIKQGAEVLLCSDTADLKDLRALAIEGTDYILIEMPYNNWKPWVYEAIERIQVKHHLKPIIAHVERYVTLQTDTQQIYELLSMRDVLGQMNTRSIIDSVTKRLCHKMLACHMVHVIGSDAHRTKHLVEVNIAYEQMAKKHGLEFVELLNEQAQAILNNKAITKKEPTPFRRILGRFYK